MFPPPLLLSRPTVLQVVLVIVVPAVFGALCGVLLGVSEGGYVALSLLGVLGGIGAGYEHPNAAEGALRGVCGGMLFGTFILLAGTLSGEEAKASLPDQQVVLPILTTILGTLFGALGGALRARGDGKAAGPSVTARGTRSAP